MSADKINIDKLAETVTKSLDDYVENVNTGMDNAIEDTADQIVKDIKSNAPNKSGKYASSWTHKIQYKRHNAVGRVVYAEAPGYRLAHLLERGHNLKRGGKTIGFVRPQVHIEPAEANADKILLQKLKGNI